MPKKENDQDQSSGPEEQEEFRLFDDEGNLNPDYEVPENAENEGTGISQAPPPITSWGSSTIFWICPASDRAA